MSFNLRKEIKIHEEAYNENTEKSDIEKVNISNSSS